MCDVIFKEPPIVVRSARSSAIRLSVARAACSQLCELWACLRVCIIVNITIGSCK